MAEARRAGGDFVLPVGTVTLLLAEVDASARAPRGGLAAEPEDLEAVRHAVGEAVGRSGGVRPFDDWDGGRFVAAFSRASDALRAALELQLTELPTSLRVALHTGEVQLRSDNNYIGAAVSRCARLCDLGHGGQTLLSQTTRDLVQDDLPTGAWLVDLGTHRLRDLARADHIHQLCHTDLPVEFPALRSLDLQPHNLPVQLTTFIGRGEELGDIVRALAETRLLTLTGSGGCGKTRLALHAGAELLPSFADGVWLVDLAPLDDQQLVPVAVARELGVRGEPGGSMLEAIVAHLSRRRALLIIDNCEHVIAACAELCETVLRGCPIVSILATSREPLAVPGETTWRVPSLSLPEASRPEPIVAMEPSDAVELFVERARHANPHFECTDSNAEAVAEICRRLDGLPLAIELAASRARVFTPQQIVDRLHDRFRLLGGGARTAVPRQHTLRASVDWSHQLLTEPERILFRRLSTFAGSFDLNAAEAVGADGSVEPHQVLDLLTLLVDKSLVATVQALDETRFRLLETVRDYASEQLEAAGELDATRRRHRDHYLEFATTTGAHYTQMDRAWLRQADEIDNVRAAFDFSRSISDTEAALAIAAAMLPTWLMRGLEGVSWLSAALGDAGDVRLDTLALALSSLAALERDGRPEGREAVRLARDLDDPILKRHVLRAVGWSHFSLSPAEGVPLFREAIDLAKGTGTADGWLLDSMVGLSRCLFLTGEVGDALSLLAEAVELEKASDYFSCSGTLQFVQVLIAGSRFAEARELAHEVAERTAAIGDTSGQSDALALEAIAAAWMGDSDHALDRARMSLDVVRRMHMPWKEALAYMALGLAQLASNQARRARDDFHAGYVLRGPDDAWTGRLTLIGLAEAELACGEVVAARKHVEEAIALVEADHNDWQLATLVILAARVAFEDRRFDDAENLGHEALRLRTMLGGARIAEALEVLAAIAVQLDSHREAARLLGAADSMRRSTGSVRLAVYREAHEAVIAALTHALGSDFDVAWNEGAALSIDEAVSYARRGRGERKRPSTGWASLTPAEQNVARLVAEGLDNKQIADRLFVSGRTVQSHLTHVYGKLGVRTRVALANEALRRH